MTEDSKTCPTCGEQMQDKGFSGDINHRGGVVGVDISQWVCDDCRTRVLDDGTVVTKIDQDHLTALRRREFGTPGELRSQAP